LGHFIQPDSIIPGAGDALSYDRYAYVKSNPINFTDPTGHYEFMNTPDDEYFIPATPGIMPARRSTYPNAYSSDERIRLIYRKAHIIKAKEEGSLGSFKELLEYSTSLYNEHEDLDFMSDFSCVVNGYCKGKEKLGGIWKIGKPDWFPNAQGGAYYIGADFFNGKGAWSSLYHDYTDNQMYHFWFYVALSYADGKGFANLANYAHGDRQNSPWVTTRGQTEGGESQQDYLLSLVGFELGRSIARGKVQLSELGEWVHQALSVPIAGR